MFPLFPSPHFSPPPPQKQTEACLVFHPLHFSTLQARAKREEESRKGTRRNGGRHLFFPSKTASRTMKARTAAASAGRAGGRGALLSPRVPADPGGIPSRPPPRAAVAVERTHLRFFPRRSFLQNTRTPPGARNAPAAVRDGEKNCISERRGEEKVEGFPRGNSPGFSLLLPLLFFSFSKQHKKN